MIPSPIACETRAHRFFGRLNALQFSAWLWVWSRDSPRFMRRHPPHHLSPARANHPAGQDPEARLAAPRHHSNAPIKTESQSFLSKIVALTVRNSAKIPGKNRLFENWVVFSNRQSLLNG